LSPVLGYVLRRLLWGAAVVVLTAVFAYGGIRVLRPELDPSHSLLGGLWSDLRRVFVERDLGYGCFAAGCPDLDDIVARSWTADVFLLAGALVLGSVAGVAGGIWCATRPRSAVARGLEALAMVLFCMPVYVLGLGLLLLFAPDFGLLPFQPLFELHRYISPVQEPVTFLRAMIVPWLVLAAPLAAVCLRLTLATTVEVLGEDYMRTALGKGLSRRDAVRRHAAPAAYVPITAYVGASIPLLVTNMVLVESVFSVPGVFIHLRKAAVEEDYTALQAFAVYGAVFIVVATLISDLVLARLDPRIRAGWT
jgi:peptide/nickel transport system permease protein